MPDFEVNVEQTETYVFDRIEADTKEEAIDKAYELLEEDKSLYHHDSDSKTEVFEV